MARTLRSQTRQQRRLDNLIAIGVSQAERTWAARSFRALASVLSILQFEAAQSGVQAVEEMLEEQGADAEPVLDVLPEAFSGHTAAGSDDVSAFLEAAASLEQLEMAMITEITDAARTAEQVAIAARPKVKGYIRHVNVPCCSRCAVLAGRFYRWSEGFERHPRCKCFHTPVMSDSDADELIQTPAALFEGGFISDLTQAERTAIEEGADISQVVNIRRKAAGLKEAGRVLERGGRLTPEGILQLASDREDIIALLERFGYLG